MRNAELQPPTLLVDINPPERVNQPEMEERLKGRLGLIKAAFIEEMGIDISKAVTNLTREQNYRLFLFFLFHLNKLDKNHFISSDRALLPKEIDQKTVKELFEIFINSYTAAEDPDFKGFLLLEKEEIISFLELFIELYGIKEESDSGENRDLNDPSFISGIITLRKLVEDSLRQLKDFFLEKNTERKPFFSFFSDSEAYLGGLENRFSFLKTIFSSGQVPLLSIWLQGRAFLKSLKLKLGFLETPEGKNLSNELEAFISGIEKRFINKDKWQLVKEEEISDDAEEKISQFKKQITEKLFPYVINYNLEPISDLTIADIFYLTISHLKRVGDFYLMVKGGEGSSFPLPEKAINILADLFDINIENDREINLYDFISKIKGSFDDEKKAFSYLIATFLNYFFQLLLSSKLKIGAFFKNLDYSCKIFEAMNVLMDLLSINRGLLTSYQYTPAMKVLSFEEFKSIFLESIKENFLKYLESKGYKEDQIENFFNFLIEWLWDFYQNNFSIPPTKELEQLKDLFVYPWIKRVTIVMGPSGVGKTQLVEILNRMLNKISESSTTSLFPGSLIVAVPYKGKTLADIISDEISKLMNKLGVDFDEALKILSIRGLLINIDEAFSILSEKAMEGDETRRPVRGDLLVGADKHPSQSLMGIFTWVQRIGIDSNSSNDSSGREFPALSTSFTLTLSTTRLQHLLSRVHEVVSGGSSKITNEAIEERISEGCIITIKSFIKKFLEDIGDLKRRVTEIIFITEKAIFIFKIQE